MTKGDAWLYIETVSLIADYVLVILPSLAVPGPPHIPTQRLRPVCFSCPNQCLT